MNQVTFYQGRRGKSPVSEFLKGLQAGDKKAMLRAIDMLQRFGTNLGMPHARPVRGKLWELRGGQFARIFYATLGERRFVLLHGYRKQTNQAPKQEIELALQRLEEVLGREAL